MDKLVAARIFIETVERGSLSAAADSVGMSRAMASRYLEGLEQWLGARLLHRTTRRLTLTDAGDKALATLRTMLELAEDVQCQVSQDSGEVKGKLRVTTSASFAEAQLTQAMVAFQVAHPKVTIDLLVLDRPVNLVSERIDLAVRITARVDEGLVARRLAPCESVLCASPAYLERHVAPKVLGDLADHRIIAHNGLATQALQVRDPSDGTTFQLPVEGSLTSNETSVLRAAALAGAGIAMLPTYYVGEDLTAGRLKRVLLRSKLERMDIQAVYASRRHQPKALRLLIDFLAERFGGDTAPWDRGLSDRR